MKRKIFAVILISLTALLLLVGCNDPEPVAKIEPEGTEKILTEEILTEEITWDNVPTQTWD